MCTIFAESAASDEEAGPSARESPLPRAGNSRRRSQRSYKRKSSALDYSDDGGDGELEDQVDDPRFAEPGWQEARGRVSFQLNHSHESHKAAPVSREARVQGLLT